MKNKLSREEKRAMRIKDTNPREPFRTYDGKPYPYFLIVIQDFCVSVVMTVILILWLSAPALGIAAFILWSDLLTKILIFLLLGVWLFLKLTRTLRKRLLFVSRLKRVCRKKGYRLHIYRNLLFPLKKYTNRADLSVEATGTFYEVMLFPARRRLVKYRFLKEGEVELETRFLKNRIKQIYNIKPRVRVKKYGFEGAAGAVKVLLLNPVPYEMYYFDKNDFKLYPCGSGAEFFGYNAYSGSGFVKMLERM